MFLHVLLISCSIIYIIIAISLENPSRAKFCTLACAISIMIQAWDCSFIQVVYVIVCLSLTNKANE